MMQARTLGVIGFGALAAAALAQTTTTPVEPKTAANQATPPAAPSPTPTPAPGAEPRTAPPANGVAPIEPKR